MTLADIEGTSPLDPEQDDFSNYEVYIRNSRGENISVQSAQFVFDSSGEPYIVLLTDGI